MTEVTEQINKLSRLIDGADITMESARSPYTMST